LTGGDLPDLVRRRFAEALGRDIGAGTSFFEAGGDSLAAEALLTALSRDLGVELPGWLLLDHPTSQALAAVLERRAGGG